MSPEFLLTSFLIIASPGTGALYTIGAGLARGPRGGLLAAFASTLGIVPHMLAAITGLAAILHTSALAFQAIKYLGVAYLLYMAWMTLKEDGPLRIEDEGAAAARSFSQVMVAGIVANLLNPKLSIFFFAFLPQFVRADEPNALGHMLGLSAVFMAMTFGVFAIYGVFAAAARKHVLARPAIVTAMRRAFAGAFAALGLRLALTERG